MVFCCAWTRTGPLSFDGKSPLPGVCSMPGVATQWETHQQQWLVAVPAGQKGMQRPASQVNNNNTVKVGVCHVLREGV